MSEDRRQKTEDRRQTTEDRSSPRFRLGKRYSSERRIRPLAALPVHTVREWALAAAKSLIKNIRTDDRVHSLSMGACQLTGGM